MGAGNCGRMDRDRHSGPARTGLLSVSLSLCLSVSLSPCLLTHSLSVPLCLSVSRCLSVLYTCLVQGATQAVYLTMAAMGAVHTAMIALLLQETLPTEERKTDPPRFQSPLGMFKLFTNGRSLRLAALSCR